MHLQAGIGGWTTAIPALPDNALIKSVSDAGLLREAVQVWLAAGRDRRQLTTCYRHYDIAMPPREWNWELTKFWQEMMIRRYINGTYLREHAEYVDLVQGTNETTSTSTWNDPADAAYHIRAEAAMVGVWNDKFRGRVVQSVDGGEGFIPADCKMTLLSGPIGNDIPRDIFRLSLSEDAPIDYHAYTHVENGVRDPGDWQYHSGRWAMLEEEYGLKPQWVFGECGPYADTDRGWRHSDVLGGDIHKLIQAMRSWYTDVVSTPAFQEGRVLGQGAWFTSGNDPRWRHYQHNTPDLIALANAIRDLWKGVTMPTITSNTESELDQALQPFLQAGWTISRRGLMHYAEVQFSPPPLPVPPFYTRLLVGTRLRVIRPEGLMVYLESGLTQRWDRGLLPKGDMSMVVALPYDPALDPRPTGVLCVLKPMPPRFPTGLWIAAMGDDGLPNVEAA